MPMSFAQVELDVEPGLTPESPLYILDKVAENIDLVFTFSSESKAQKYLEIAQERSSEASIISDSEAIETLDKDFDTSIRKAESLSSSNEDFENKVDEARKRHAEVLKKVVEDAPDAAKEGLETALSNSIKANEAGISAVSLEEWEVLYTIPVKYEGYSQKFEGKITEVKIISPTEETLYYKIEEKAIYQSENRPAYIDYTIVVQDKEKLMSLIELYKKTGSVDLKTLQELITIEDGPDLSQFKVMFGGTE